MGSAGCVWLGPGTAGRALRRWPWNCSRCSSSIMRAYRRLCEARGARPATVACTGRTFRRRQPRLLRSLSSPACRRRSGRRSSIPAARQGRSRAGISTMPSRWRCMRHPCCGGSDSMRNCKFRRNRAGAGKQVGNCEISNPHAASRASAALLTGAHVRDDSARGWAERIGLFWEGRPGWRLDAGMAAARGG